MGVDTARRRFAAPSRKITAYLRLLGRRHLGGSHGLASLRGEVEPRLRVVVADALGVEPEQLAGDVALEYDLAVDSLDLLEVLGRVEEAFDVVVPDREAAAIRTVDDLTAVTTALVACRARARDAASSSVTVLCGDGSFPRFLRTFGVGPYDQEVLRDDLRRAELDEPVVVSGVGELSSALERTLLRARLAGADVRTEPRPAPEPWDEDARAWPADRLAGVWGALVGDLIAERDVTLATLERRPCDVPSPLAETRAATDGDVARFRAVVETYLEVLADLRPLIHAAASELGRLALVRRTVDERAARAGEIRQMYDGIADAIAEALDALRAPNGGPSLRHPPQGIARRADRESLRA